MRRRDRSALTIEIDGAARGNPGPAGVGVVLTDSNEKRHREVSLYLGEATNNVAESCALVIALQESLRRGCRRVRVLTDSELLARQVRGEYRVKDPQLRWLHVLIQHLVSAMESFQIEHRPRAENRRADRLANRAVVEGLRREGSIRRRRRSVTPPPAEAVQPTLF